MAARRRLLALGLATGSSALLITGCLAVPARAAGTSDARPQQCPLVTNYHFSSVKASSLVHARVFGQSGITLSITEAKGTVTTGTWTGSGKFDIGALIAQAEASVSKSIAHSKTSTITRGGSWTVPRSQKTGWLADGAQSRHMNWRHEQQRANCTTAVLGKGVANLPTLAPYIFHS